MHEKFALRQSQAQFARLMKLSEEQRKALKDDPMPFLYRAQSEVARCRRLLDQLRSVLDGCETFLESPDPRICESLTTILHRRNQRALLLISDYYAPAPAPTTSLRAKALEP